MYTLNKATFTTKNMVKISILAVISMVLMIFDFATWFAPPFMNIDLGDMPALIGSFAMGPMAGVLVQLLKNILHLLVEGTKTGGIGELSNFIVGSIFAYTAGFIYHRDKTFKTAIIALLIGVLAMTTVASLSNYFIVFPLYAKLIPMDQIIEMSAAINSLVVDYKTMILYAVVPFNLLKGSLVSVATILVYKRISPILKR